jgi:hypothetical protein
MDAPAAIKNRHPDMVVRLVGPGLNPSAVPFRSLARILGAVQRLVEQKDYDEEEDASKSDSVQEPAESENVPILHLIDVKESSAAYLVRTAKKDILFDVLNGLRQSIVTPSKSDWLDSTISSIRELSDVARGLRCNIEFREPDNGSYGVVIASIEPETYDRVKGSAFVYGDTAVFARIEKVGGATAKLCQIRLPHAPRKMVTCDVASVDLVRRLGQYIYENVLLMGRARWLRHNWRLKRLDIKDFQAPKTGSIREALERIGHIGNGVWEGIADPDTYIAEMRRA